MARIVPSDLTRLALSGAHEPEIQTLAILRDKFAYQIRRAPRLEVEYLIYCPDYAVKQLAAAAVDADRVVDAQTRDQLDFDATRGDPDFWIKAGKQVEEQALGSTPSGDWRFDTLIVDEAQDFEEDWFEAVRLFLRIRSSSAG